MLYCNLFLFFRLYVTGDVDGYIKFYDRKLRILFWITDFKLNPIVTLDFHRYPRKHCYEDIGEKYHTCISLVSIFIILDLTDDYF